MPGRLRRRRKFYLLNYLCIMDKLPTGAGEAIVAVITSAITFLLSRRKNQADIKALEIANEEKAVAIWRNLCEDLKGEVEQLRHDMKTLRGELAGVERENRNLRAMVDSLNRTRAQNS